MTPLPGFLASESNPSPASWSWNGAGFIPCAGIPLTDRGFRYGMAFFESLAVRNGRVEFFAEHKSRLEAACRQCGWAFDSQREGLERAGEWLREACGAEPAFARIYLTAGDGGLDASIREPRLFLFAEPRSVLPPQPYRLGISSVPHLPLLGGLKTANYWGNLEALAAARNAGANEALRFNPQGELISACMANVFAVMDGELVTPPLATGARRGVVREWVMQRRAVTERILLRSDLGNVEEYFLTSSWMGIIPVASLNSSPLQTTISETLRGEWADFFK